MTSRKTRFAQGNEKNVEPRKKRKTHAKTSHELSSDQFYWDSARVGLLHEFYKVNGRNLQQLSTCFATEGVDITPKKISSKLTTEGIKQKLPLW